MGNGMRTVVLDLDDLEWEVISKAIENVRYNIASECRGLGIEDVPDNESDWSDYTEILADKWYDTW